MNPFKQKQLEEFTIADCELYISKYPYGEHLLEVKHLLRELKKQKEVQSVTINIENQKKADKPQEIKSITKKAYSHKSNNKTKDIAKTVFAWIGIIVVVLVVGTIIICILSEILPQGWQRYKPLVYFICLGISKLFKDKF